jgi:hypothetical protein
LGTMDNGEEFSNVKGDAVATPAGRSGTCYTDVLRDIQISSKRESLGSFHYVMGTAYDGMAWSSYKTV